MSNEIIKEELICGQVEFLPKSQVAVDNRIISEQEISKIISVKSVANILHTEILQGEIHLSGKLKTDLVFVTTSNLIQGVSNEIEWTSVIKNEKIQSNNLACCFANVIECSITNVALTEVVTSNIVELDIKIVCNEKMAYVSGGADGVHVLNEEYNNDFLVATNKQSFNLEFEVDVKNQLNNVLSQNCCLKLRNIRAMNSMFVIDGEAFYDLFVSTNENNIDILNENASFVEEVLANDVNENSIIDANLSVLSCSSEIKDSKILIKVEVLVCYNVYNNRTLNLVSDAFSVTNDVNLKVVSCVQNKFKLAFTDDGEISGNALVNDDNYEIRKVVGALTKNLVISNSYYEDGEFSIEGMATFTTVYIGVDGDINSTDVDLPFICKFRNNDLNPSDSFYVTGCLSNIRTRIRKMNEIEISANIQCCIKVYQSDEFAFIGDVEIGDSKESSTAVLTIYTVKNNESLFDVAKKLSVSLSDLLLLNPELSENLEEGQQIVIYKQKAIN